MPIEQHAHADVVRSMVLAAEVTRYLTSIESPAITAIGNSNTVWRIFAALGDGGTLLPSELASRLDLDRSVVSRSLNRLQSLGLVTRRVSTTDRRQVRVSLSARGRIRVAEYEDAVAAALAAASPLIDEMSERLPSSSPRAAEPGGLPLRVHIDRLGAVGTRMDELVALEAQVGIEDWSQRNALWSVVDARVSSMASLERTLRTTPVRVEKAVARLEQLGLVARAPSDAVTATAAGLALVDREAQIFTEHSDDLVTTLAEARDAALARLSEPARD